MNAQSLFHMAVRMLARKAMNKGVNMGVEAVAGRGRGYGPKSAAPKMPPVKAKRPRHGARPAHRL